jgi:hypothetical protein
VSANPVLLNPDPADPNGRVTLRDLFAGLALQGIVTTCRASIRSWAIAELAYSYADAMLEVREEKP